MRDLMIIGAGGHGRVIADIALALNKYSNICFLDDGAHNDSSVNVVGKVSDYKLYIDNCDFVVAIGNNSVRKRIQSELLSNGAVVATLIHPAAVIGSGVSVGRGTVVMAGAVINANTKIGEGVIINTSSSVDHDCVINDYCHISVGSHLAGTVHVGNKTMIGAGATVINNITICEECLIGAGAVVVRDIAIKGTYVGVPTRRVK